MAIHLDHVIVPARDTVAAAHFFAHIFDAEVGERVGPLTPAQVNDSLTLEFDQADAFEPHHYGFLVGDEEFDAILARVKATGAPFGAGVEHGWNGQVDHANGGRRVYFQDPDGHSYEIFTRL